MRRRAFLQTAAAAAASVFVGRVPAQADPEDGPSSSDLATARFAVESSDIEWVQVQVRGGHRGQERTRLIDQYGWKSEWSDWSARR